MAINQLNKYVWLVETIHRAKKRGGITLKELDEMLAILYKGDIL